MRDEPTTGHEPSRAATWWIAFALTAAGAVLRLSTLNTRSFWLDEATSVRQAGWSIPVMLEWMAHNVHPPLFHTLLHFWMVAFGRAELVVRLFSVMWGLAAIPLVYWAARSFYDRRTSLIAAAVVTLSPFFIWYAQEARTAPLTKCSPGTTWT